MDTVDFEDHVAITRLVHEYCRVLDEMDLDGLASVFTEDCVVEYGGDARHQSSSREALRASLRRMWRFEATSHHASNIDIRPDGDAAARVVSYVVAWHRSPGGESTMMYGRYVDRVIRRDGEWRIAHRVMSLQGASAHYTTPLYRSPRRPPEPGWEEALEEWSRAR